MIELFFEPAEWKRGICSSGEIRVAAVHQIACGRLGGNRPYLQMNTIWESVNRRAFSHCAVAYPPLAAIRVPLS